MPLLDDLLEQVADTSLQTLLRREIDVLRRRMDFGLVFDRHIPETATISGLPIRVGSKVRPKSAEAGEDYIVASVSGNKVSARSASDQGKLHSFKLNDVVAVARFGDPLFSGLTHIESLRRSEDRPTHVVIEAENYHALQMLSVFGEDSVDVIYLDPPYNIGTTDWKYNNRFVDKNDLWRHSKWLSMMERRLVLAKRILRSGGVLIVSIDENEHAHLVCVLEDLFRGCDITSVAIVHNPRGVQGDNFSQSNDFAVFVTPSGKKVIAEAAVDDGAPRERRFRVWGNASERKTAKNCFYPVLVQDEIIVGFGDVPPAAFHPDSANVVREDGTVEVWPIDSSGIERKWRYQRGTIDSVAHLLSAEQVKGRLEIRIDKETGAHKTVWTGSRYDGGSHGKRLLRNFGVDFDYPKSLYTMRDILYACTAHKRDAVILDFFAGSGTTLHAACLLNAEDGGARRTILVTNNEVEAKTEKRLRARGLYPGDKAYEEHGIFRAVTMPRCRAAISGVKADGQSVVGSYLDGSPRADGFQENVAFFKMLYLDRDEVELGRRFSEIHALLWLSGLAMTDPGRLRGSYPHLVSSRDGYGVLFDDAHLKEFAEQIVATPEARTVFHVTDDESAFAELVSLVGTERGVHMLFRDYLSACLTNAG